MSFKPSEKLAGDEKYTDSLERKQDLLELERAFAEGSGWPWALVTEKEVPEIRADNLVTLNEKFNLRLKDLESSRFDEVAGAVMRRITKGVSLAAACDGVDRELRLRTEGTALSVSLNRLARKVWSVDLDLPLDPRKLRPANHPPRDTSWVSHLSFL